MADGEPGPSLTYRQQLLAHRLFGQLLANYQAGHSKSEVILDRNGNVRVAAIGHAVQIAMNEDGALMPSA